MPQTILLNWGEVSINKSVHILAPRYQSKNDSLPLVEITWNASLNPDPNNDDDRSVFNIEIAKTMTDGRHPIYSPSVRPNGLKMTGGKSLSGGGIRARGFLSLVIDECEITGNIQSASGTQVGGGSGAGIAAIGVPVANDIDIRFPFENYGPIVEITNSIIAGNSTPTNDETSGGTDVGGGIYLGSGASLGMASTKVAGNTAENGGAGIYFAGGQFYENASKFGGYELFSTYLKINNCEISENTISSMIGVGSGGGILIAGPTMGMIGSTTFSNNKAREDGGAIKLTGGTSYARFVGSVFIVNSTMDGNVAAFTTGSESFTPAGDGGAVDVAGIVNRAFVINSTLSGNQTINGHGGAIAVTPRTHTYSYLTKYIVNYG